ncbi:ATP synthase F1 subunit delta [Mongoliitalea daihaiensis]|uniref:ATP synthase F1 subunit delta n=1 Tax=Mongoliitalea daihaiensis TaxID=2782006 RepID=UPI001F398DAC|nr:ATP synthase F1 subunit delta [Mongoliitalea daihaiensis]UJP66290.1 ATP synthase F1 subunit delta [Mongoliitalea daihaiensis]
MSDIKVASRYAKALIELAIEKEQLEEVFADIQEILSVAESNREFQLLLQSPIVNLEKKKNVIHALFANHANRITISFYDIVVRKNRANVLLSVAKEFVKQYNAYKGIQVGYVTTTIPLTDELRKSFESIVSEISGLKNIQLVEKVNPELIGGFVLKVNDKLLDDSVSGKLRTLRTKLNQRYFVKSY